MSIKNLVFLLTDIADNVFHRNIHYTNKIDILDCPINLNILILDNTTIILPATNPNLKSRMKIMKIKITKKKKKTKIAKKSEVDNVLFLFLVQKIMFFVIIRQ
jgi:hypothetical protein